MELLQKTVMTRQEKISAITNNYFVWLIQAIFSLLIAVIIGNLSIEINFDFLIKILLIGIIYFAGGSLFYTSYKSNSSSTSLILGSISVIISTILGSIIFQEVWSINKLFGVILIIGAIIFLNYRQGSKFDKYNFAALGGGIFFGIAYTVDKAFVLNISPFLYLGFMSISVALISMILAGKHILKQIPQIKSSNVLLMIGIAFFGTLFNLLTNFAYKADGNVGVLDAMNNSVVFFLIPLEIIILHDRTQLIRKLLCSFLALCGILLIAI